MKYTIDAKDKKLGRIASAAAALLLGKNSNTFAKNVVTDSVVEIVNASRTDIDANKKVKDVYTTYTGYRGGLKSETLGELITRRGISEVYTRAIYKMLPNNKLRDLRMKNLKIKE